MFLICVVRFGKQYIVSCSFNGDKVFILLELSLSTLALICFDSLNMIRQIIDLNYM